LQEGQKELIQSHPTFAFYFLVLLIPIFLSSCSTPIGVERVSADVVHEELTSNVLTAGTPSEASMNVLGQHNLLEEFEDDPKEAWLALHKLYTQGRGSLDETFALSELAFLIAEWSRDRAYYLASALYAYAFLFPDNAQQEPNSYDRRLRVACDLYNRGLTEGFKSSDHTEVELQSGTYDLPFGQLEVDFSENQLTWIDRRLEHFVPVAELDVRGLRNRYRIPGIGAPLAAGQVPLHEEKGFQVAPKVKVPVTAVLRVEEPRRQLISGQVRASLELYVALDTRSIKIGDRDVPLEVETTSYLALSLEESPVWEQEITGFFSGGTRTRFATQLASLEPYRPGRFPVVLVHGTASSPARWAEMLNDLTNDQRIGKNFQLWFFTYDTGNPIPYSAMQLRDAVQEAIQKVDPQHRDPALQHAVVIGHSQGGLLTKLTAVDTGDRLWNVISKKPLEDMDISQDEKDLFRRMLFIKPLPFVRRVVFISTPHHGSFVASMWVAQKIGGAVKLPGKAVTGIANLTKKEQAAMKMNPDQQFGAVFGMTPGHPGLEALAEIPIDDRVTAHSIIALKGSGPPEKGDDGVVKYKSAHIDGVASELVVRSGHSTQSFPPTIEEVRRILLLHAKEWCGKEVACEALTDSR
jgi:pimeloyl-ACP methyl ester carboxylesterase